jgi:Fe-S cluster biosynthesis and repair protein YggX
MPEERTVNCVLLKKELPGFASPPFPGDLGKKVFDSVSKEAFGKFLDYFKIIVNEYRLDLADPATDKIYIDQMEEFLFGKGGNMPEQFTEPDSKS